ncbi:MAG: hypothetical protein WD342_01610 [Verrucomicrobiales bacterium]
MKKPQIFFGLISLIICDQAFSNSRAVGILVKPPAATSIENIEYLIPATGSRAVVPPELIREFLSDGENLKESHVTDVTRNHREIWNRIIADSYEFLHAINAQGVLVDDNYKVFRWRLIAPNLMEISDYGPNLITFIYLSQPTHAVTIEGKSPKDFFLEQKRKKDRYKRERKQKEHEEQAKSQRTGMPRGLEPIESDRNGD